MIAEQPYPPKIQALTTSQLSAIVEQANALAAKGDKGDMIQIVKGGPRKLYINTFAREILDK